MSVSRTTKARFCINMSCEAGDLCVDRIFSLSLLLETSGSAGCDAGCGCRQQRQQQGGCTLHNDACFTLGPWTQQLPLKAAACLYKHALVDLCLVSISTSVGHVTLDSNKHPRQLD